MLQQDAFGPTFFQHLLPGFLSLKKDRRNSFVLASSLHSGPNGDRKGWLKNCRYEAFRPGRHVLILPIWTEIEFAPGMTRVLVHPDDVCNKVLSFHPINVALVFILPLRKSLRPEKIPSNMDFSECGCCRWIFFFFFSFFLSFFFLLHFYEYFLCHGKNFNFFKFKILSHISESKLS